MHSLDVIILRNARAAGREAALAGKDEQLRIAVNHEDEVEATNRRLSRAAALKVDSTFIQAFFNEPR